VSGQEQIALLGHTGWVSGIAFSPDGAYLATSSEDKTAKVWNVETGQELLTLSGHTGWVRDLAFGPDSKRLVTVSHDGTAIVWSLRSGRALATLSGHTGEVWGVAFSADGKRLATISEDRTARVWDAASGKTLLSLDGQTDWGVAFSPDSARLATGSVDRTVKVWDVSDLPDVSLRGPDAVGPGDEVLILSGHTDVINGVTFSPDGTRLATCSGDSTVRIVVLDVDDLIATACSRITRNFTQAEWEAYLGYDVPYRRTCPDLPVPPSWLTHGHID
jgi:WD40 repeat protein